MSSVSKSSKSTSEIQENYQDHYLPPSMPVKFLGSAAFVIVQTTARYFHITVTLNHSTITTLLVQVRPAHRLLHTSAVLERRSPHHISV